MSEFPAGATVAAPKGYALHPGAAQSAGELGRLNEVFAKHKVNIGAQYYQTAGDLGYVVLDADGLVENAEEIVKDIRAQPGTIRARMLYRRS